MRNCDRNRKPDKTEGITGSEVVTVTYGQHYKIRIQ